MGGFLWGEKCEKGCVVLGDLIHLPHSDIDLVNGNRLLPPGRSDLADQLGALGHRAVERCDALTDLQHDLRPRLDLAHREIDQLLDFRGGFGGTLR